MLVAGFYYFFFLSGGKNDAFLCVKFSEYMYARSRYFAHGIQLVLEKSSHAPPVQVLILTEN